MSVLLVSSSKIQRNSTVISRVDIFDYSDLPKAEQTNVVTIKAYLPVDEDLDDRLRTFEQRVQDLAKIDGFAAQSCRIEWHTVQDEDWADNWKAYFHTEKVGGLIVIKPAWEDYEASPDDIVIDLDPGAAFGTGTHPTTAMCIRELESAVKGGMRVFDVGTGSGVLAVAAAKLGAGEVVAMDYDRTAATVAQENVERNHVEDRVTTGVSDLLKAFTGKADRHHRQHHRRYRHPPVRRARRAPGRGRSPAGFGYHR